ncbi:amidohydrolase family protein [Nonomuraea rubra]|uniref:amidohydrolase family protein n=1 Tax=Nonomuraea rubra TaxID=46180 RepID=UPI003CD066B2
MHLVGYAGPATARLRDLAADHHPRRAGAARRRARPAAMRHGVTTLRDLAGDEAQIALRRVFDAGVLPGPRIQVHGVVGMTAGHNDLFVPPAFRSEAHGRPGRTSAASSYAPGQGRHGRHQAHDQRRRAVHRRQERLRNYTRDEIRAARDEAHALGMLVASHAALRGRHPRRRRGGRRLHRARHADEPGPGRDAGRPPHARRADPADQRGHRAGPRPRHGRGDGQGRRAGRHPRRAAGPGRGAGRAVRAGHRRQRPPRAVRRPARRGRAHDADPRLDAESALRAATSDAADSIGMPVGRVAVGLGADLVVLRGRPWERIEDLATEKHRGRRLTWPARRGPPALT